MYHTTAFARPDSTPTRSGAPGEAGGASGTAASELAARPMQVLLHELRSPLSAIVAAIAVLERVGASTAVAAECFALVRRQTAMIDGIVSDLAAAEDPVHVPVATCAELDARQCVQDAVALCQPLVVARRHELAVSLPEEPVWWHGRAAQLVQCIVNFIDNAAHYTPAGGHIRVTLLSRAQELCVSVADDGMGFSDEAVERILRPFEREASAACVRPDGRGIGLAVADTLARAFGGAVRAESRGPGQGSTFTLVLPRPPGTARAGAPARTSN